MRIVVQGISPQGFPEIAAPSMHRRMTVGKDPRPVLDEAGDQIWDAGQGRFFPTSAGFEIEVLEQDEDPPEVVIEVPNTTTGKQDKVGRPDPVRMGRKSYEALISDTRFRIMQTDQVDSRAADAAVASARAEVARLSAELVDAKGAHAATQAELDALTEEHAKVLAQLDEATAPEDDNAATKETPPSA